MEERDFRYSHYKKILLKLKENHEFCFLDNFSNNDVILRHDVDISLISAVKMAKIESELGIKSTYFILFHSQFYNPFSVSASKAIQKIIELGHKIGLHYDRSFFIENKLQPGETISEELKDFSQHFNQKINLVSAHNPTLNKKNAIKFSNEIIDADSPTLKIDRKYISDSVQYWREGSFSKFTNLTKLYILIHPIWWTEKGKLRNDIMDDYSKEICLNHKKEICEMKRVQDQYVNNLRVEK